jgi:hypothetical protein
MTDIVYGVWEFGYGWAVLASASRAFFYLNRPKNLPGASRWPTMEAGVPTSIRSQHGTNRHVAPMIKWWPKSTNIGKTLPPEACESPYLQPAQSLLER